MSSLSSIDKLPNMAAKTDAVSPCKQITSATDVTPVKWGYFLHACAFGRMSYSIFFMFSNQTSFLSAVKICGGFVAEGGLLKQCGFLLCLFKIALFGTWAKDRLSKHVKFTSFESEFAC